MDAAFQEFTVIPKGPIADAQVDFPALLGPEAWGRLPRAVQARFATHPLGFRTCYDGRMQVRASLAGRLFAQICRLIGTPLAPWIGDDVATRVDVWLDARGGLVWDRRYHFPAHQPLLVTSRKVAAADGGLLEVTRAGLGMALRVSAEDGAVHFRSTGYFLSLLGSRLPIPDLLTPGRAHVVHRQERPGHFRFTLSFQHPWLGETFHQDGVFTDPLEAI
jgi:hypothetical protein